MKCAIHSEVDSVAFCGQCGRPVCSECRREVRGMAYCESCIAARLQAPGIPGVSGPGVESSPGVALALGFIPGVGAIYNGQIPKALIQAYRKMNELNDEAPRKKFENDRKKNKKALSELKP